MKVCWFCHNQTMSLVEDFGGGWVKCTGCGATEQLDPIGKKLRKPSIHRPYKTYDGIGGEK